MKVCKERNKRFFKGKNASTIQDLTKRYNNFHSDISKTTKIFQNNFNLKKKKSITRQDKIIQ
jgi:hypothetical protein